MTTINAAVVRERGGAFRIEQIDLDDSRDNEMLVRIVLKAVLIPETAVTTG